MFQVHTSTPSHLTEQSPSARLSPLTPAIKVRTIQQSYTNIICNLFRRGSRNTPLRGNTCLTYVSMPRLRLLKLSNNFGCIVQAASSLYGPQQVSVKKIPGLQLNWDALSMYIEDHTGKMPRSLSWPGYIHGARFISRFNLPRLVCGYPLPLFQLLHNLRRCNNNRFQFIPNHYGLRRHIVGQHSQHSYLLCVLQTSKRKPYPATRVEQENRQYPMLFWMRKGRTALQLVTIDRLRQWQAKQLLHPSPRTDEYFPRQIFHVTTAPSSSSLTGDEQSLTFHN